MPWTNIARREHKRETDRYPSDLTDAEWLVIASLLPAAKSGGRKRTTQLREVVTGTIKNVQCLLISLIFSERPMALTLRLLLETTSTVPYHLMSIQRARREMKWRKLS